MRSRTQRLALATLIVVSASACSGDTEPEVTHPTTSSEESNAPGNGVSTVSTRPETGSGDANAPVDAAPAVVHARSGVSDPVEAAIRIVELKEDLMAMTPSEADAAMRALSAPSAADLIGTSAAAGIEKLNTEAPAGAVLRVAVLETRVVSQTGTTAVVAVWVAQVVTAAGNVKSVYTTITHHLELIDGQWLLTDLSQTVGPVPAPSQAATDPARFESDLAGFDDLDLVAQK